MRHGRDGRVVEVDARTRPRSRRLRRCPTIPCRTSVHDMTQRRRGTLRTIDGWRRIAAVLNQHTAVAA